MSYNVNIDKFRPYTVIDNFDEREIYSGSYEDCQNFIAEQSDGDICGMYDIIPNPYFDK